MALDHAEITRNIMDAPVEELLKPKYVESNVLGGMANHELEPFTIQVLQVRQMVENMKTSESARKFTWAIVVCTIVIALTSIANVWIAIYF